MNYRKIRSLGRRESPGVKKLILTTIISLGVGFAAASWLETAFVAPGSQSDDQAGPVASSFDDTAPVEERIHALERAVVEEREARQALEDEVLFLTEEIDRLNAGDADSQAQVTSARQDIRDALRSRRFGSSGFTSSQDQIDRLVAAGFPPGQAESIVQREAELQMERLQARYEAMRENEVARFFGPGISEDSGLRAELGEADYERYLQANGRSTAVNVGNVLPNSPAQQAGLQPGDQIVRYDGERVFSMMDMTGQIMRGQSEGDVVVDVIRDGIPMQLVIRRGPLGVMGN
jgi:hypothetical protein